MSLIKSTKLEEANKFELEISVDKETFCAATMRAYKKEVKKISIKGFRKGKVPKHIIERMYGENVFFEDAIEVTYPTALADAIDEVGIMPVKVDDLKIGDVSEAEGYTFTAVVIARPELTVEGYKGIEVERPSTVPTDEMVDAELESVRERNSRMAGTKAIP